MGRWLGWIGWFVAGATLTAGLIMKFEPECTDSESTEQGICDEFSRASNRSPDRRHHTAMMSLSDR